jgi:hypothetical protein
MTDSPVATFTLSDSSDIGEYETKTAARAMPAAGIGLALRNIAPK